MALTTKKFYRYLFFAAIIFVAALLMIGLVQPRDITVSRSTYIVAPKQIVFYQMVNFRCWPNWSPWTRLDSSMKNTFSGTDGQPGSKYHWVGDPKKTGEVEITNQSVRKDTMVFRFELLQPSHMTTSGSLSATDSAGGTKATFSFTNHFDYPWNAMSIFMDLDNILSKDFENGLANLKNYTEGHPSPPIPETPKQ